MTPATQKDFDLTTLCVKNNRFAVSVRMLPLHKLTLILQAVCFTYICIPIYIDIYVFRDLDRALRYIKVICLCRIRKDKALSLLVRDQKLYILAKQFKDCCIIIKFVFLFVSKLDKAALGVYFCTV